MKETSMPFDHRPDPVLGSALRQALSADDHSTFVARVTAAVAAPQHPVHHWDILASWAKRGAAVACVAALAAGLLVSGAQPAPVDLVGSVAASPALHFVSADWPPQPGHVLLAPELP